MIAKDKLCQDWRILKPSKDDTLQSKKEMVGNNVAREPWCK